ncbi:hypothetical protein LINPERHAP1_LOCUS14574 [Linum perenne]
MGFIPTEESRKNEIEDCKQMLVSCTGLSRRKDEEEQLGFRSLDFEDDGVDKIVAIVNRLLVRGYSVRILLDNQAARIGDRRKFDDDRDVNLVRFGSGSGIAKDDRGWLLDPISLALKHGLKGGAGSCASLHVGEIRPGTLRGNHRLNACNETLFCLMMLGLPDFNNNQGFQTLKLKVGKNLKVIQAHRIDCCSTRMLFYMGWLATRIAVLGVPLLNCLWDI